MDKVDVIGKCLSVTIDLIDRVETDRLGRITSLKSPYDTVRLPDSKKLNNILIVVSINIVGSTVDEKNIFNLGLDKLDLKLIIRKCSDNPDERLSMELHNFEIDLTTAREIKGSGFPKSINTTRFLKVDKIDFSELDDPLGNYVLFTKVDVEDSNFIVAKGLKEIYLT